MTPTTALRLSHCLAQARRCLGLWFVVVYARVCGAVNTSTYAHVGCAELVSPPAAAAADLVETCFGNARSAKSGADNPNLDGHYVLLQEDSPGVKCIWSSTSGPAFLRQASFAACSDEIGGVAVGRLGATWALWVTDTPRVFELGIGGGPRAQTGDATCVDQLGIHRPVEQSAPVANASGGHLVTYTCLGATQHRRLAVIPTFPDVGTPLSDVVLARSTSEIVFRKVDSDVVNVAVPTATCEDAVGSEIIVQPDKYPTLNRGQECCWTLWFDGSACAAPRTVHRIAKVASPMYFRGPTENAYLPISADAWETWGVKNLYCNTLTLNIVKLNGVVAVINATHPAPMTQPGVVEMLYSCTYPGCDTGTCTHFFSRRMTVYKPILIEGGLEQDVVEQYFPDAATWEDQFPLLDPSAWRVDDESTVTPCDNKVGMQGGVVRKTVFSKTLQATMMHVWGNKGVYPLIDGSRAVVHIEAQYYSQSTDSEFLMELTAPESGLRLTLRQTRQELILLGLGGQECRRNCSTGDPADDNIRETLRLAWKLGTGSSMSVDVFSAVHGRLLCMQLQCAIGGFVDGEPLLLSIGAKSKLAVMFAKVVSAGRRKLARLSRQSDATVDVVQSGKLGAAVNYVPPRASCVHVTVHSGAATLLPASTTMGVVDTTTPKQINVAYRCYVPGPSGVIHEQFLFVNVLPPMRLYPPLMKIAMGTASNAAELGGEAVCLQTVNGVIQRVPALYNDGGVMWTRTGFYEIQYHCGADPNITGQRKVEISPAFTMYGSQRTVMPIGATYVEFGARCIVGSKVIPILEGSAHLTYKEGGNDIEDPAIIGTQAKTYTATYECGDAKHKRTIIVADGDPECVMRGSADGTVLARGEQWNDPGMCCQAPNAYLGEAQLKSGSPSTALAGSLVLMYECQVGSKVEACPSTVHVNSPPTIFLLGKPDIFAPLGVPYVDAGVACIDVEDGIIGPRVAAASSLPIPILRGWVNDLAKLDRGAIASLYDGVTTSEGTCSLGARLKPGAVVVLDLGAVRHMKTIRIVSPVTAQICITTSQNGNAGNLCHDALKANTNVNVTRSAYARYVHLHVQDDTLWIGEVQVFGSVGPRPPGKLAVVAQGGCSGGVFLQAVPFCEDVNCPGRLQCNISYAGDGAGAGLRYMCKGSNNVDVTLLRSKRSGTQVGEWNEYEWVMMISGTVYASAIHGSHLPPPNLFRRGEAGCRVRIVQDEGCNAVYYEAGCGETLTGPSNLAYIESSSSVRTDEPGLYAVVHMCMDSFGEVAMVKRTVKVACEEPNDDPISGGNQVGCFEMGRKTNAYATWEQCSLACAWAGEDACTAYEFDPAKRMCYFRFGCSGRLQTVGTQTGWQVGYCRRVDKPPVVLVDTEYLTMPYDDFAEYMLTEMSTVECDCKEYEDRQVPTCTRLWVGGTPKGPGEYYRRFTCIDSAGQTDMVVKRHVLTNRCNMVGPSSLKERYAFSNRSGCTHASMGINYGETCKIQCHTDFRSNYPGDDLMCELPEPDSVQPAVYYQGTLISDGKTNIDFCGRKPCDELMPTNVLVIDGKRMSCAESTGSAIIADGQTCTPRCTDGYATLDAPMTCDTGTFKRNGRPAEFTCVEVASGASSLRGSPSTLHINLTWSLNVLQGACTHDGFVVEGVRDGVYTENETEIWTAVEGCENKMRAGNSVACVATALRDEGGSEWVKFGEGERYRFRVQEICVQTLLNSPWVGSAMIETLVVPEPNISFRIPDPGEQVFISPELVISLWTPTIRANIDSSSSVVLTRLESPGCPPDTFRRNSASIAGGSAGGGGDVDLINDAILTVVPPAGFWLSSCSYTFVVEAGVLKTKMEPAKPNPEFRWGFTWVEVGPVRRIFHIEEGTAMQNGSLMTLKVEYDKDANITCTAQPQDGGSTAFTDGLILTDTYFHLSGETQITGASISPRGLPVPRQSVNFIAKAGVTKILNFHDLVPSLNYSFACDGKKVVRWWVLTECQNGSPCPAVQKTTPPDESKEALIVEFMRLAICTPKNYAAEDFYDLHMLETVTEMKPARAKVSVMGDKITGQVLQVLEWEKACNVKLQDGQKAYMRMHARVYPWARYSSVRFKSGPYIDMAFERTQGVDAKPRVETQELNFEVCSHKAMLEGTRAARRKGCKEYTTLVAGVDGTIAVESLVVVNQDGSERQLPKGTSTVQLLDRMRLTIADRRLDVSEFGLSIGPSATAFVQDVTVSADKRSLEFAVTAQGLGLGIYLIWLKTDFYAGFTIDVDPPDFFVKQQVVTMVRAPHSFSANLQLAQPLVDALLQTRNEVPPDMVYRVSAKKVGTESPQELCDNQHWRNGKWIEVECNIVRAPLVNLQVALQVRNFTSEAFQVVERSRSKPGVVTFQKPELKSLSESEVPGPTEFSLIKHYPYEDIKMDNKTSGRKFSLYIHGTNFPVAEELAWGDVDNPEIVYELWVIGTNASGGEVRVTICESILRRTSSVLECRLSQCVDARHLSAKPTLQLQLGDLFAHPGSGLVELPRPVIDSHGPETLFDTGMSSLSMVGRSFGVPLGPGDDFEQACKAWHDRGIRGASALQLFGTLKLKLGLAECEVVEHTDSRVICNVSSRLRPARKPVEPGQLRGEIVSVQPVLVSVLLGEEKAMTSQYRLDTELSPCPDGKRRVAEEGPECEPCPVGTYAVDGEDESPLQCTTCPRTMYQDEPGSTECKACPDNTVSKGLVATRREDCVCLPGYYSPVWSEDKLSGVAGYACKSCQVDDLMTTPPRGILCGRDYALTTRCDTAIGQACVPLTPGSYDYRVCKLFCPGGNHLPVSKPQYFVSGATPVVGTTGAGAQEFRPYAVRCEPEMACTGRNRCTVGYSGEACQECVFGYYRDKTTNLCMMCDDTAIIGTIVMTGVSVVFSLGAFFASLFMMKVLADPIFKSQMVEFGVRTMDVIMPSAPITLGANLYDRIVNKRYVVKFTKREVALSRDYFRNGELGFIFRIDDHGRCHVAEVVPKSPAEIMGVQQHWILRLVNGKRISVKTEDEAHRLLATASLPLSLMFVGLRFYTPKEEEEEDGEGDREEQKESAKSAFDALRMATMTLSIMQSFNFVARLDLQWPPIFTKLAALFKDLTFSFDFFHPECSVAAPYEQTWAGFVFMPYGVVGFITLAYVLMWASLRFNLGLRADYRNVSLWLCRNAYFRACLAMLLIFLANHMELLWAPFTCFDREDGTTVMTAAQDIPCDTSNERYSHIFSVAVFGWMMLSSVYSAIFYAMYKAYFWQVGVRIRVEVPATVAAIETSAAGMKGFSPNPKDRLLTNIVSPIIFPSADQEITAPRVVTDERDTASNLREQQEGVEDEWGNRYMHGFQARRHQLQAQVAQVANLLPTESLQRAANLQAANLRAANLRAANLFRPAAAQQDPVVQPTGSLPTNTAQWAASSASALRPADSQQAPVVQQTGNLQRVANLLPSPTMKGMNMKGMRNFLRRAATQDPGVASQDPDAGGDAQPDFGGVGADFGAADDPAPAQPRQSAHGGEPRTWGRAAAPADAGGDGGGEPGAPSGDVSSTPSADTAASTAETTAETTQEPTAAHTADHKADRGRRRADRVVAPTPTMDGAAPPADVVVASSGAPRGLLEGPIASRGDWQRCWDAIAKADPERVTWDEFRRQEYFAEELFRALAIDGRDSVSFEDWVGVFDELYEGGDFSFLQEFLLPQATGGAPQPAAARGGAPSDAAQGGAARPPAARRSRDAADAKGAASPPLRGRAAAMAQEDAEAAGAPRRVKSQAPSSRKLEAPEAVRPMRSAPDARSRARLAPEPPAGKMAKTSSVSKTSSRSRGEEARRRTPKEAEPAPAKTKRSANERMATKSLPQEASETSRKEPDGGPIITRQKSEPAASRLLAPIPESAGIGPTRSAGPRLKPLRASPEMGPSRSVAASPKPMRRAEPAVAPPVAAPSARTPRKAPAAPPAAADAAGGDAEEGPADEAARPMSTAASAVGSEASSRMGPMVSIWDVDSGAVVERSGTAAMTASPTVWSVDAPLDVAPWPSQASRVDAHLSVDRAMTDRLSARSGQSGQSGGSRRPQGAAARADIDAARKTPSARRLEVARTPSQATWGAAAPRPRRAPSTASRAAAPDTEARPAPPRRVQDVALVLAAPPDSARGVAAKRRQRRRERVLPPAVAKAPGAAPRVLKLAPGSTVITTTELLRDTLGAAEQFAAQASIKWPDELPGSFLTYGWVLVINTWTRPFLLLTTIAMVAAVPPMAASGQATVFFLNFALILSVMPYSNDQLSQQEALLVGCLALLTWGAAFRDLLQSHERAQDHPITVERVGTLIDAICVLITAVMFGGIACNIAMAIQGFMVKESPEHALNRAFAWKWKCIQKSRESHKAAGSCRIKTAMEMIRDDESVLHQQANFTQLALEITGAQHARAFYDTEADAMNSIYRLLITGLCPEVAKTVKQVSIEEMSKRGVVGEDQVALHRSITQ